MRRVTPPIANAFVDIITVGSLLSLTMAQASILTNGSSCVFEGIDINTCTDDFKLNELVRASIFLDDVAFYPHPSSCAPLCSSPLFRSLTRFVCFYFRCTSAV